MSGHESEGIEFFRRIGAVRVCPCGPRGGKVHGCIGGGVDPVDFLDQLKVQFGGLGFDDYAAPSVDSVRT